MMIDRACISLGQKCNLSCRYCHFQNRKGYIDNEFEIDELIEIVNNIVTYCSKHQVPLFKIGLVGAGEPLLEFNKICELLNYVKSKKINNLKFYTITNGTILSGEILQFFFDNRELISLGFSLDGYEEIHNFGREQYNQVIKNIEKYELIFGSKPFINCTVHKKTIENGERVLDFFQRGNFKNVTFSRIVDVNDSTFAITRKMFSEFLLKCQHYNIIIRQNQKENKKKFDCTMYGNLCGVGKTNVFFTKKGIFPCGRFYNEEEYLHGPFNSDLSEIETQMRTMKNLQSGECYYDKYVEGIK